MATAYRSPLGERVTFEQWAAIDAGAYGIGVETIRGATVSTVFIGVDDDLYETAIFGGTHDGHTERWPDRDAAIAGHRRIVDQLAGADR